MNKLERISNIAVILTCLIVVGSVGRSWYQGYEARRSNIHKGQLVSLPGQALAGKSTLVMALSVGCHFCQDSVPFYQKLSAFKNSSPGLRMVAVFPQPTAEAIAYLKKQGIAVDAVASLPLGQVGVRGTPTLLLLDEQSKVHEVWEGKLNDKQETEVISSLKKVCPGCALAAAVVP